MILVEVKRYPDAQPRFAHAHKHHARYRVVTHYKQRIRRFVRLTLLALTQHELRCQPHEHLARYHRYWNGLC